MLIALPPSETKTVPTAGPPVDLKSLAYPALAQARAQVMQALVDASGSPQALSILKVGETLRGAVRANLTLTTASAGPAADVYTGVLFDAFDYASLDAAAQRRAEQSVRVFSALFGVVRLSDKIPAYRLSGGGSLPGIGSLSTFWRRHLTEQMDGTELVIDCRSSSYASMWKPANAVPVRVFREHDGRRTVVSHQAKYFRGLLARALCASPSVDTAEQAADVASRWMSGANLATAAGQPISATVAFSGKSIDIVTI